MPGYVIHMTFAKLVQESLNIKDKNRYLVGALVPDACTRFDDRQKTTSHFGKKLNGLFKNLNIELFKEKYSHLFDDDLVLGIYTHLYLDKYFYTEFMYDVFEYNFEEKTMLNKKTGRTFKIWNEFFCRTGIYEEYSAMNKKFIKDYNLDVNSLNFSINNLPLIEEFDYARLTTFKNKYEEIMSEDGIYTGEYLNYNDVKKFLESLAFSFKVHIRDFIK